MKCEVCDREDRGMRHVRADEGEVVWLCTRCVLRVRVLDASRTPYVVVRGPVKETRMRFFPNGYSADLTTLAIDRTPRRFWK